MRHFVSAHARWAPQAWLWWPRRLCQQSPLATRCCRRRWQHICRWLGAGALGMVALVLTFSRASWLGAAVMLAAGAGWYWRYASDRWPRYRQALLVFVAVGAVAMLPLLPLLAIRADFSDQAVSTE